MSNRVSKQALTACTNQQKRNRLTREALTDVDAGRVIDHQIVQAWADSLNVGSPHLTAKAQWPFHLVIG
ncbi:CopG family ribbon-helix-helix protein [Pseudomonas sp. Z3-6]|uniref:CopG family ribbon-helix-helix protein n=1 Tax=Pseudomonas sp. Z3-6 TaxID=2817411 RepID=UPI003DA7ABC6